MNQGNEEDLTTVMEDVAEDGLLTSLCTITVSPEEFELDGAPSTAAYVDLEGHVNIPCMLRSLTANESKDLPQILALRMKKLLLDGYYPAIKARYRAEVDGAEYDILGALSDSQSRMTYLNLQTVEI